MEKILKDLGINVPIMRSLAKLVKDNPDPTVPEIFSHQISPEIFAVTQNKELKIAMLRLGVYNIFRQYPNESSCFTVILRPQGLQAVIVSEMDAADFGRIATGKLSLEEMVFVAILKAKKKRAEADLIARTTVECAAH